jgi:hypothetical protein
MMGTSGRLDLRRCFKIVRNLYIAFGYGLGFLGQNGASHSNREFGNTLVNTGEIKRCQRRQRVGLELQNRCSATELNWLKDFSNPATLILADFATFASRFAATVVVIHTGE